MIGYDTGNAAHGTARRIYNSTPSWMKKEKKEEDNENKWFLSM